MIFIMIGHLGVFKLPALNDFHVWIYSFHIPLFFFLSGFLFKPEVSVKRFALSKLKSIVIPYFCTGVIIIIYELFRASCWGGLTWEYVGEQFKLLLIQRRTWTIWFLAALLVVNIATYFLQKVFRKDIIVWVLCALIAAGGLIYYSKGGDKLPWDVDVAMPAMPFFYTGYLLKKHLGTFTERLAKKSSVVKALIMCLVGSIITAMINYKSTRTITDMFGMKYGFAPLMYISAFAGIAAILLLSSLFTFNPIHYIGMNSLTYFAFHQTIMMPLTYAALDMAHITINAESEWWVMILYWLLVLVIINIRLTVWNFVLTNTRLGFIVGKWRKMTSKKESAAQDASADDKADKMTVQP